MRETAPGLIVQNGEIQRFRRFEAGEECLYDRRIGGQKRGLAKMASYVEKTLAGGEEIIHRANFNWTYSFFPVFWFSLGAAPLAMFFFLQFAAEMPLKI